MKSFKNPKSEQTLGFECKPGTDAMVVFDLDDSLVATGAYKIAKYELLQKVLKDKFISEYDESKWDEFMNNAQAFPDFQEPDWDKWQRHVESAAFIKPFITGPVATAVNNDRDHWEKIFSNIAKHDNIAIIIMTGRNSLYGKRQKCPLINYLKEHYKAYFNNDNILFVGSNEANAKAQEMEQLCKQNNIDIQRCLLADDRDDYLGSAKKAGFQTIKIDGHLRDEAVFHQFEQAIELIIQKQFATAASVNEVNSSSVSTLVPH